MIHARIAALALACVAVFAGGQVPPQIPAWLVHYPGTSAETKLLRDGSETSYSAVGTSGEAIAYFKRLFAENGLKFEPMPTGDGYFARTDAPECILTVLIRTSESHTDDDGPPDTAIKVTCTARETANHGAAWQVVKDPPVHDTTEVMKKFDKPVYPDAKAAAALKWPSWLVGVDGTRLRFQTLSGQLKSSFPAAPPRYAIEVFYADLLDSHGYRVNKSLSNSPAVFGSWLEGIVDPDAELGRRTVIRINIKPIGQNFDIEITVQ